MTDFVIGNRWMQSITTWIWEKICFCFAMMLVFTKDISPLSYHPCLDTLVQLETWTLNSRLYKVVWLSGTRTWCAISTKYIVILSYIDPINKMWHFLYSDTSLPVYVLRQCMIIVPDQKPSAPFIHNVCVFGDTQMINDYQVTMQPLQINESMSLLSNV